MFQYVEKMESLKIMICEQFCNLFTTFTTYINSETTIKKARLQFTPVKILIPFIYLFRLFIDDVGKSSYAWYGGNNIIVLELTI